MTLVDYFGVFSWISEKRDKISKNMGNFGVLRLGVAERGLGQASGTSQRSSATPWRRSTPQRSYYSQYGNFCVLFCFVFPLLQGLVYWTNEDPIRV